jgi:hypothetical protein
MANAVEFLARWTVRYINAEGRIPEELETTVAECLGDANEEGFFRRRFRPSGGRRSEGVHSRRHREDTGLVKRDVGHPRLCGRLFPISAKGACVPALGAAKDLAACVPAPGKLGGDRRCRGLMFSVNSRA